MPNELCGDHRSVSLANSTVPVDTGELFPTEKKYTWLSFLWMCHVVESCQMQCVTILVLMVKNVT